MGDLRWVQMTDGEIDGFLGDGGTGVISFSTEGDEPPFSIPVSYGYDEGISHFYYELSMLPDSKKVEAIERPVSFVVHGDTETGWKSVVATGELERVTDFPYESTAVQGMWAVDIPRVDIFDRPPEDVTFRTFRLVPASVTGRKEIGP
jgi:uncharacterized protein